MLKTVSSVTNALGAVNYKGTWDASSNSPTLVSGVGSKGDYYVVSVAGTTTLDGISLWSIGDWAVFNGSVWQKVNGATSESFINIAVTSLTGYMYGNGAANVTASTTIPVTDLTGTLPVSKGGTGQTTFPSGYILYGNGTGALSSSANMTFDGTKLTLANDALIHTLAVGLGNNSISTNSAFGVNALNAITTGSNNLAIGYATARLMTTGSSNTGIGSQVLYSSTTGSSNVGIGLYALFNSVSASNNVAIGVQALVSATAGNNTAIGYQAGLSITTGTNNIVIGNAAASSSATVANEITIGNSSNTVLRYPHNYSTVASLPSASTVGRGSRTFVTDALTPVFQATVTGGGAVFTPVYSDGTNWKVG
jgi:hypothetical protein